MTVAKEALKNGKMAVSDGKGAAKGSAKEAFMAGKKANKPI